jgi:hypothetical protein
MVRGGSFSATNCTLLDCLGGAMNASGGLVTLQDSLLRNNTAEVGGAVWAGGSSHVTIRRSTLELNHATLGGALAVDGGTSSPGDPAGGLSAVLNVYDSLVQENEAAVAGGALYMMGGVVKLSDKTLLQSNSAINGSSVFVEIIGGLSAILRYEVPTHACRASNSTACTDAACLAHT